MRQRFSLGPFRGKKGAIKLHTVLVDMPPHCVILSDGKKHDLAAAKEMQCAPGDLLIRDRASIHHAWLYGLHRQGVWFVARLKTNACREVQEDGEITDHGQVLADRVIRFTSDHGCTGFPEPLRRVHHRDPEIAKKIRVLHQPSAFVRPGTGGHL